MVNIRHKETGKIISLCSFLRCYSWHVTRNFHISLRNLDKVYDKIRHEKAEWIQRTFVALMIACWLRVDCKVCFFVEILTSDLRTIIWLRIRLRRVGVKASYVNFNILALRFDILMRYIIKWQVIGNIHARYFSCRFLCCCTTQARLWWTRFSEQ